LTGNLKTGVAAMATPVFYELLPDDLSAWWPFGKKDVE
jgi:hypothetical protein